jgi:hypothetical protein
MGKHERSEATLLGPQVINIYSIRATTLSTSEKQPAPGSPPGRPQSGNTVKHERDSAAVLFDSAETSRSGRGEVDAAALTRSLCSVIPDPNGEQHL